MRNDQNEITADQTATGAPLVITWTANEPTAGSTQTIADGTVPTVAELGQAVKNLNTIITALTVDVAALIASTQS